MSGHYSFFLIKEANYFLKVPNKMLLKCIYNSKLNCVGFFLFFNAQLIVKGVFWCNIEMTHQVYSGVCCNPAHPCKGLTSACVSSRGEFAGETCSSAAETHPGEAASPLQAPEWDKTHPSHSPPAAR